MDDRELAAALRGNPSTIVTKDCGCRERPCHHMARMMPARMCGDIADRLELLADLLDAVGPVTTLLVRARHVEESDAVSASDIRDHLRLIAAVLERAR